MHIYICICICIYIYVCVCVCIGLSRVSHHLGGDSERRAFGGVSLGERRNCALAIRRQTAAAVGS